VSGGSAKLFDSTSLSWNALAGRSRANEMRLVSRAGYVFAIEECELELSIEDGDVIAVVTSGVKNSCVRHRSMAERKVGSLV
jgi:hypothetical protein